MGYLVNKYLKGDAKVKEKEIFEQFLRVSQINEEDVIDYRYCTEFYTGVFIPNSIIIQLKGHKHIIYTAYNIDNVVKELSSAMGNNTDFEQGFHHALDEVKNYYNYHLK